MKVLEVWFTPHCIDNLVSYTLITIDTNFNINKVKKNAKNVTPLNFEEREKNKAYCQKNWENQQSYRLEKLIIFAHYYHSPQSIRLWYDSIQTFF